MTTHVEDLTAAAREKLTRLLPEVLKAVGYLRGVDENNDGAAALVEAAELFPLTPHVWQEYRAAMARGAADLRGEMDADAPSLANEVARIRDERALAPVTL